MTVEWLGKCHCNSADEFAQHIAQALEQLKDRKAPCWVCGEETNSWIVIMPEEDDIGFGSVVGPDGKKGMRIAFAPVCAKHDITNRSIRLQLIHRLNMLKSTLTN